MVGHVPSMSEVLGSVPRTNLKKKATGEINNALVDYIHIVKTECQH